MKLAEEFRHLLNRGGLNLPLPGHGDTPRRHKCLAEIARRDLSLARLAEAHCDAVAILNEAGATPVPGALYGVWASDGGAQPLAMKVVDGRYTISGQKMFCTGAGIVDRALITAGGDDGDLIDVDFQAARDTVTFDLSTWKTAAFADTQTATATFSNTPVEAVNRIGSREWYLERAGFWHGACGPAACWAGGALRLVDYALKNNRDEPHSLAHLGALKAAEWALDACMNRAGCQIDDDPYDPVSAKTRALMFRHIVEQTCSEVLERFGRAYGPRPLAYDGEMSRHYQELILFLRQCHAERDLEVLARTIRSGSKEAKQNVA